MVWLSVLLITTQALCWVLAVVGPNVCSRQESYMVTMRVLEKRPITTKTYTWCLRMPPRCTKYKQEMVDHYRIQTEPRKRWVNECCSGFEPDETHMYCVPTCSLGCDHGNCTAPETCLCLPGYTGSSCQQKCPEGHWGEGCQQTCPCLNSSPCNHETGECMCPPGYLGSRCESPCPRGSYGERCEMHCSCQDANLCHHVTGACDTVSSCNETTRCQAEETSSHPEMIQRLVDNASVPPVHEPLVNVSHLDTNHGISESPVEVNTIVPIDMLNTTSSQQNLETLRDRRRFPESNNGITDSFVEENTSLPIEGLNITTPRLNLEASTDDRRLPDSSNGISESPVEDNTAIPIEKVNNTTFRQITETSTDGRSFLEEQSHEDQLENRRAEQVLEDSREEISAPDTMVERNKDHSYNRKAEQVTERVAEDISTQVTVTEMKKDQLDNRKAEQVTERVAEDISTQVTVTELKKDQLDNRRSEQVTERVAEEISIQVTVTEMKKEDKTEEQRKKPSEQKKPTFKERNKDSSSQKLDVPHQPPADVDHDWTLDVENSPKLHDQVQDNSPRDNMGKMVDLGKPKRISDEKRTKDLADIGQLQIQANEERQHNYSEFLSSFSIAAGVSTGIIMVAGLITLMARCRRAKPDRDLPATMEMDTIKEDTRASIVPEETALPVVRPLFFSPVYLPGDVSPTEGNGLILTAVFSRPATNIHELYRQQDLLRETLAPHYDVPPPTGTRTSICTSVGTAEPEHVYEELPYWRNQGVPPHSESDC